MAWGDGGVYRRRGTRYWWIHYSEKGKQRVESSRSTFREDAQRLLAIRTGKIPNLPRKPQPFPVRKINRGQFKNVKNGPGWVYVLRIRGGPTKIGCTLRNDPFERIRNLQCDLPYDTELIGFTKSDTALSLEAALHDTFKDKWIRGEWFQLDKQDFVKLAEFGKFVLDPAEANHV